MLNKIMSLAIVTTAAIALTACGSTSKQVESHNLTTNLSGLILDRSEAPTLVYKRPNAPTLAAYNQFIVDYVQVDYRDEDVQKLKEDDVKRIQIYFQKRIQEELRTKGFAVRSTPAENTMRISTVLSGLKAPNALPNAVGLLAPVALSVGGVTVEATFSETLTNRIDAVVINKSEGSRVLNAQPWSTWADVESALDKWAVGVASAVKAAHSN